MSYLGTNIPEFLMPVGTVLPYAGSSAPSGYLFCDGTAYLRTTYAALFGVLSTTYITQVNPTTGSSWADPGGTYFRVPDLRGTFIRGVGTPYQGDAVTLGGWQTGKTAVKPDGVTGLTNAASSLTGSTASDGSHNHACGVTAERVNPGASGGSGLRMWESSPTTHVNTDTTNSTHSHSLSSGGAAAQSISGDNETRPHNKGLNYIIKF